MFKKVKQGLARRRVKDGDGRPLAPFRWWHLLAGRKLFYLPAGAQGGSSGGPSDGSQDAVYAVDVHQMGKQAGDDALVHLYRGGRHVAYSKLPASFPVDGGSIDVERTMFGLRRCHFVPADGSVERRLVPDERSAIGRRLRLERRRPGLSRAIGFVSFVALIVGVTATLLELAATLSEVPPIAERFGVFDFPLPLWLTIALACVAAMASAERALRLRYHWLLDGMAS